MTQHSLLPWSKPRLTSDSILMIKNFTLMSDGNRFYGSQRPWFVRAAGFVFPAFLMVANANAWATETATGTTAGAQETETKTKVAEAEAAGDQHNEKAKALVDGMAEAMMSLNYSGEFVHIMGATVESMRILHAKNEHGEFERLTSLNGEAREVYRNDMRVTCVWPGSKSVIVGSSKDRQSIPRIDADVLQSEFYRTEMLGADRVASRETYVVDINPEDEFRFGYRFWIDKENNMLLRMLLLDETGGVVEQLMFTSIEYPQSIDESLFEARFDANAYTLTNTEQSGLTASSGDIIQASGSSGKELPTITSGEVKSSKSVGFSSLPGGYYKISETYNPMPIGNSPISHVTISDGMASVSVYVEFMAENRHEKGAEGISRMGAVSAYGTSKGDAFVTVVGEVPAAVVKAIADSIVLEGG